MHIAQGGYDAAVSWLTDAQANPNSSAHFVIAKDGRISQLVSIKDGAWANGLAWVADATQPNGGYWNNPRGVKVAPSWKDIISGVNPNLYTISVEHEGFYQDQWTQEMYDANNKLLAWIAAQLGQTPAAPFQFVAHRSLIGHYEIDPVDRANCPGPNVNFDRMALNANAMPTLSQVTPQAKTVHVYGTTALLSLPSRQLISQVSDTDVDVYGYYDFQGTRWYISNYSFQNELPYFFQAAATVQTPALTTSLCLNPGFRDAVTPSADEMRALAPAWVRVLLFSSFQNKATGQNTELDWLLDRLNTANPNIQVLVLINPETLNEVPPAHGGDWTGYISRASDLAQKVASFYRGRIGAIEIFNEPDIQQVQPEDYAALLKAAYTKVKSVSTIPVISAGICCGENFDYLRRVVAAAPDSFDFAGWHTYAERVDGWPAAGWGFGELRNSVNTARAIAGKPLWITEIGAQLDWGWAGLNPPDAVADYLNRSFDMMSSLGRNQVAQAFWFTWRIAGESWGMVDDSGMKRPAWFTFQQRTHASQGPPVGKVEVTNVSLSPLTLDSGQALNVSITVHNGTTAAIPTQDPPPGFAYAEGDSFLTRGFAEINGAYRVGIDFDGRIGIDHPYRWGLGSPLNAGDTRTITGTIKLNNAQTRSYWAGMVRELQVWVVDNLGTQTITVRPPVTPPPPTGKPTITAVSLSPTTLDVGQALNVSISVRNDSSATMLTQGPTPGFSYNEGETFVSKGFPEVANAFRVGIDFDGRAGIDHPYRWGLSSALLPGETRTINGTIRLNNAQVKNYWVGLVKEQIEWVQDKQGIQLITVKSPTTPPPPGGSKPTITSVVFTPSVLDQGQIVQVRVTVRNDSNTALTTQGPDTGFMYNEGDNYLTKGGAPVPGMWRVGVDYAGRTGVAYPYRWGLGAALAPGQSAVVVGFMRLNRKQNVNYWVALIQEENNIVQGPVGVTDIEVDKA